MEQSVYFQSKHQKIISRPDKAVRKTRLLGRTEHIPCLIGVMKSSGATKTVEAELGSWRCVIPEGAEIDSCAVKIVPEHMEIVPGKSQNLGKLTEYWSSCQSRWGCS